MVDNEPAGQPGFRPSHPGRILRGAIDALGISIESFADRIGVSRQTVHNILSGRSAVTADVAVRLGRALGNSALFWTNLQARHDVWAAEKSPEVRLVRKIKAHGATTERKVRKQAKAVRGAKEAAPRPGRRSVVGGASG